MTTFSLDDIPTAAGPRPVGSERVRRTPMLLGSATTRRRFLAGAATAGIGVGLAAAGLLPPARRANATHKLNDGSASSILDWSTNGCPNYPWYDTHGDTCDEACGDSPIHGNACMESGTWQHWHKDHSVGAGTEWKLRPDDCVSGLNYDGWRWKVPSPCNGLAGPTCNNNSLHRCHDGSHNHGTAANPQWHNSICRFKNNCDVSGSN